MSELGLQQYHCSRCDSVFKAAAPLQKDALCPECGKPPGGLQDFNSIENMQQLIDKDSSHGVAGRDAADFVSMQIVKRKRRVIWALALWFCTLVILAGIVYYNREVRNYTAKEPSEFIKKEREYQKVLERETVRAMESIDQYINGIDAIEKSRYVLGGVKQILNITKAQKNINFIQPRRPLKILGNYLHLGEKLPRLDIVLEDANQRKFEMILRKIDSEKWKLDWQQHARFSDSNWTEFLVNQPVGKPQKFRLYLRRRHLVGERDTEMINLVFYLPRMDSGKRMQPSPEVKIFANNPLFKKFSDAFDSFSAEEKSVNTDLIGSNDTDDLIRVRVTLDWINGSQGKPELVVKTLDAVDWLDFESVKEADGNVLK